MRLTLKRLGFCFLALGVLLVAAFLLRAPILARAANAWMVNEPAVKADAIVLLGGGMQFRSIAAAELYRQGLAPRILIMNSELRATDREELTLPEQEIVHRLLLRKGVPESAIAVAGTNLTSTFEEACTTRDWCKTSGARTLLIPTGPFHTRRVKWVFGEILRNTDVKTCVTAIHPEECAGWWMKENTLIDFQNEAIKYAMYLRKY